MISSPCEVCVYHLHKRSCGKRGRILEKVWLGERSCDYYNDNADKTLDEYKRAIKRGELVLNSREDSGLFTF